MDPDPLRDRLDALSPEKRRLFERLIEADAAFGLPPQADFVAPRDEAESTLASIWADTLGVPRVGIHDNFFDLGGDSIHCIQIVARASQAGLRFGAPDLLEHPTVAELAAHLARVALTNPARPSTPPDPQPPPGDPGG